MRNWGYENALVPPGFPSPTCKRYILWPVWISRILLGDGSCELSGSERIWPSSEMVGVVLHARCVYPRFDTYGEGTAVSYPVSDSLSRELEGEIKKACSERHLIGVSIGIVRNQELVWAQSYGYADLEQKRTPDESTLYRIGSITKTLTGAAIFQLRDQGKLDLDDPLSGYIPEFSVVKCLQARAEGVTLRRMLCHHSGLMSEAPCDCWETLKFPSIEQILLMLPNVEVVIEPDSAFKYSNLAFTLLGEVVCRVSGRPFSRYVKSAILEPLGMRSSTFGLPKDDSMTRMAVGYCIRPEKDRPFLAPDPFLNAYVSAGGLYSCVADLAKWIEFQFRTEDQDHEDTRVLSGRTLLEMQRPQFLDRSWNEGHCLPWRGRRVRDEIYLGHEGCLPGFLTNILFSPQKKLGLIVLTNTDDHPYNKAMIGRIVDVVARTEGEQAFIQRLDRPLPIRAEWKELLGRYILYLLGTESLVEFHQGELVLVAANPTGQPIPPVRLQPTIDVDTFMATSGRNSGEFIRFRRGKDGKVTGYTAASFFWRKQDIIDNDCVQ
jgi:CubicO group peptidase (beta-lactamase class C family)